MDVFLTGPYERVLPRHNLSPRTTHLRQRKWRGLDIEGIKSGSFQSVRSAQACLRRSWYECRLTRGTKWRGRCPSTLLQQKLLCEVYGGGMLSPFLKTRTNYQYINYLVRRYTNTVKYSIKSWNICDTEWACVRDLTQASMRLTKAWHFWQPVSPPLLLTYASQNTKGHGKMSVARPWCPCHHVRASYFLWHVSAIQCDMSVQNIKFWIVYLWIL